MQLPASLAKKVFEQAAPHWYMFVSANHLLIQT